MFFKFEEKWRIVSMWLVQQWIREEFPPKTLWTSIFRNFVLVYKQTMVLFRDTFVRQFSLMRTIIFFLLWHFSFSSEGLWTCDFCWSGLTPSKIDSKIPKTRNILQLSKRDTIFKNRLHIKRILNWVDSTTKDNCDTT
jgi:hypothetical protein